MTDRPRPFSEDELIAYTRGSASGALSHRIETAMTNDPEFRAEIALMRAIKPALATDNSVNPPGEFGWRRLEADIRRETAHTRSKQTQGRSRLWRVAAVVFGLAALGQAGYIANLMRGTPEAVYQTASDPSEAFVLSIAFSPDAKAADTLALLRWAKGRVIGGPSALGLYRVQFLSAEALAEGRTRLKASELIDLVADE